MAQKTLPTDVPVGDFLAGLDARRAAEGTELLDRLGPHRRDVDCVYVRRLDAIDREVLRELVALSWEHGSTP
jgi:hypothetical protein